MPVKWRYSKNAGADSVVTRNRGRALTLSQDSNNSPLNSITSNTFSETCNDSVISSKSELLSLISSLLDSKLEIITQKIDARIETFLNSISSLEHKVTCLESKMAEHDIRFADMKRFQRANDVIITGIPFTNNEAPTDIYKRIANVIGAEISPFTHAFRVNGKSNNAVSEKKKTITSKGPIVVKLSCPLERRCLFNALKRFGKPLTLEDIGCGFLSSHKIGIFESLLPEDLSIKKEALRLCKVNTSLRSVKTLNGAVFVSCGTANKFFKVTTMDDLKVLADNVGGTS